jgi:hypothetical protein
MQVEMNGQKNGKRTAGKHEQRKQKRVHQLVYFLWFVLFLDQFKCKRLAKPKRTQIEIIGDPEQNEPHTVQFFTEVMVQQGRQNKHGHHIDSDQRIAASQMEDKPLIAGNLSLYPTE